MSVSDYLTIVDQLDPAEMAQTALAYVQRSREKLNALSLDERRMVEAAEIRARKEPAKAEIQEEYARLLAEAGDIDRQVDVLREATRIAPSRGWTWIKLGNALQFQGKWTEAIEAYQEVIHLPLNPKPQEGAVRSVVRSTKMVLSPLATLFRPDRAFDELDKDIEHLREGVEETLHAHWMQFAYVGILRCAAAAGEVDLAKETAKQLAELEHSHCSWWRRLF